jgi:hypothetical protein
VEILLRNINPIITNNKKRFIDINYQAMGFHSSSRRQNQKTPDGLYPGPTTDMDQ